MFLTCDILKQYNVCQAGYDWFVRHYPNGADTMDIIYARHIPPAFLHWGKLYLTTTPEEQRAYNEVLHIENCDEVFECSNISNCSMITSSDFVTNSKYIYNCKNIDNSEDISNSSKVKDSVRLMNCSSVFNSTDCALSHNIKESNNICNSDFVISSHDIYNSSLITQSSFIFNSKNIDNCGFISHSYDLSNALFCYEYNTKEDYALFNHPINQTQWEFLLEEYQDQLKDLHLRLFEPWNPEEPGHQLITHRSYAEFFKPFEEQLTTFISWVQHLPYYNAEIAYNITFIPNFLQ